MAIKTYPKGTADRLSTNFRASEFDCHGSGCCKETKIDEKLVVILQKIRDHFQKPVIVTAYRCPVWNAKVANAASRSYHMYGQAADIHIDGIAPAEIAKYAESIGVLGIGLYETDKDGYFVHVDTRTTKSFWYGHAQERRTTFVSKENTGNAQSENQKENGNVSVSLRNLKRGDSGSDVRALQILLSGNGCKGKMVESGYGSFGKNTEKSVKMYQAKNGLPQTGVVDSETWNKILGV